MTVATADEIKLLFLEFQSAGVALHQTLNAEKQLWGREEFRRQGSGWESAVVCWIRKLTTTKPTCADRGSYRRRRFAWRFCTTELNDAHAKLFANSPKWEITKKNHVWFPRSQAMRLKHPIYR
jgi:hypothetical protein